MTSSPPPLPPRASSSSDVPPPYSVMGISSQDPRSSSTQSLVPDPAVENTGRRRLLLVYIHGFMGNETSFRSFPAHVHNLVTITLADSHVVHTKLYPRYKSRDTLGVARDNFSTWLAPHEDQWTDVILLGHSMGGLLAADIALVFRHRIIGIVNFDVPFLGMHPGIVKAGLGSIFSPSPAPQDAIVPESNSEKMASKINTIFNPKPSDPNYNPAFPNDVQLPARKGWENSLHWVTKHYKDGLKEATKGLIKSHLEFGGAMADYRELKDRYARVRALEQDDESKRMAAYPNARSVPRIRFVNYYTASTGRPKKPKSPKSPSQSSSANQQLQHRDSSMSQLQHRDSNLSASVAESQSANQQVQQQDRDRSDSVASSQPEMTYIDPEPIPDSPRVSVEVQEDHGKENAPVGPQVPLPASSPVETSAGKPDGAPNLPEIPPIPQEPPFVDLMQFTNKTERRAAEKEHSQALKVYQKAVKVRNKTINERTKLEERWEKQEKQKEQEKLKKQKEQEKQENQERQGQAKKDDRQIEREQREAEAEQRQAEARQREMEAEQRQTGADLRRADSLKQPEKPEATPIGLEEDLGAMHLQDQPLPQQNSQGPYDNYDFSRSVIMDQAPPDDKASLSTMDSQSNHQTTPGPAGDGPVERTKLRKFCMLPPKDAQGNKDPTWVSVFMEGVDEVTAHTTLFFVSETYERLVGDVGARIEDWVREADSMRLVREMSGLD